MQQAADDQYIIARVLEGRKEAYAVLVSRYENYVFTLVSRYISSREEAEEVAQDVFIKAYKSLGSFRAAAKFSTWLYTIVHTTCLSRLRLRTSNTVMADEEMLTTITAHQHTGYGINSLEQKSQAMMLENAICRLQPEDAQLITLFYQAGQSLEEMAQILMIPANTIKVKLHRARQKLKNILVKHYPEEMQDFQYSKNDL